MSYLENNHINYCSASDQKSKALLFCLACSIAFGILEKSASSTSASTSASSEATLGNSVAVIGIAVTVLLFRLLASSLSIFALDQFKAIFILSVVVLGSSGERLTLVSVFAAILSHMAFAIFALFVLTLFCCRSSQRYIVGIIGDDTDIFFPFVTTCSSQVGLSTESWSDTGLSLCSFLFFVIFPVSALSCRCAQVDELSSSVGVCRTLASFIGLLVSFLGGAIVINVIETILESTSKSGL